MGKVRIRHYRIRKGRAYWEPAPKMRAVGFKVIALGPDGPDAWKQAERMNAEWDKARTRQYRRSIPAGHSRLAPRRVPQDWSLAKERTPHAR
jgi:hypothetical protein